MKYSVEFNSNSRQIIIDVDKRVSDANAVSFDCKLENANDQQPELVKNLFKIEGVCEVVLYQYSVNITIGKLFSKEKLFPGILNVICQILIDEPDEKLEKVELKKPEMVKSD